MLSVSAKVPMAQTASDKIPGAQSVPDKLPTAQNETEAAYILFSSPSNSQA